MLDTLDIEDGSGKRLMPLPYLDTKALLMVLVEKLFSRTFTDSEKKVTKSDVDWPEPVTETRDLLLELVSADLSGDALRKSPNVRSRLDGAANSWRQQGGTVDVELLKRLQGVCEFFEKYFVLIVETKLEARGTVKYTRALPLFMQASHATDSLRALLGLRPSRFTIPLSWPFSAGSYHFRIVGESSLHVCDHSVVRLDTKEQVTQASLSDGSAKVRDQHPQALPPSIQIRERSALPQGHVHVKNFCCLEPFGMATVVRFEEVPPGVLGSATVVSILTTALVLFFMGIGTNRNFSSGLPAFLLALPAFAASWLGISSDSYRILRTSLTARLGLIGVGIVSIISALLFLGQSLGLKPLSARKFRFSLFGNFLRLHDVSPWWFWLAMFSVALTATLSYVLIWRSMSYFRSLQYWSNVDSLARE